MIPTRRFAKGSFVSNEYEDYVPGLNTRKSREHYQRAKDIIPGGASSHCRCYPVFTPYTLAWDQGKGSKVKDLDGNEYIDCCLSMGPLIHGHCHPRIVGAIKKQLEKGTMFAMPIELEVEVAEKIRSMVKSAEMVRFCNTGLEATMHAIRAARGHTGKKKIIKFEGCYHGVHDYVLLATMGGPTAGPEHAPYKIPVSWGIPEETLENTILLPWNNLGVVERTVKEYANELAAVITEPIMMNIGTVPPAEGYLKGIQEVCNKHEVIFILDEIISGFRLAPGGAQEVYGLKPDMSTFAKALGAGVPISAFTGKRDIMEKVVPGKIFHGGTYNANPLCLAAAKESLAMLSENSNAAFRHLEKMALMLIDGLDNAIQKTKNRAIVQGVGAAGCQIYFSKLKKITNYREFYSAVDEAKYVRFHREMLKRDIYFHPAHSEHLFVSTVHSVEDMAKVEEAALQSMKAIE